MTKLRPLFTRIMLAAVLGVTASTSAFAEVSNSSGIFYYNKGATAHTYYDNVKLYAEASEKSAELTTLPVDTPVTIEEDASDYAGDKFYTQNGLELPFIKVSTDNFSQGYIWAGNLAKTTVTEDLELDDVPEHVLTNVIARKTVKKDDYDQPVMTIGIKTLSDGKLVDETTFESTFTEANSLESTVYTYAGFSPYVALLRENFIPGACGVVGGNVFMAWHNKHWVPGFTEEEVSDAGAFSNYVEFVFPLEHDGKMNAIKAVRTVETDFDDNTNMYKKKEVTTTVYDWQDGTFKKTADKATK